MACLGFCIVIVVGIMVEVIGFFLGLISAVGATIGGILSMPTGIISRTLLYYDLRVRKQGYSLATLATELGTELNNDL